ncbi:unnamed protein product [Allacma fusca]|uniref:Uncharacterized protein n=1 Tax=Allacma fusca TaxID=39272 RepID=A0A8J2KM51_9HEXA|nr:unnamed protein product [Allacma fusca]
MLSSSGLRLVVTRLIVAPTFIEAITQGVYDAALSNNPLNLLTNVDVISVIRKSLDFDDMVTVDASFACLADVMFPITEEVVH